MKKVSVFGVSLLIFGVSLLIGWLVYEIGYRHYSVEGQALRAIANYRRSPHIIVSMSVNGSTHSLGGTPAHQLSRDVVSHLEMMLDTSDSQLVIDVAGTIAWYDPKNPLPLGKLLTLLDSDSRDIDKANVIHAIGRLGPRAKKAIPRLLAFLDHPNEGTLLMTVQALERIGQDSSMAIPQLIPLLNHKREWVVIHVAQCLGEFGSKSSDAVPLLLSRFAKRKEPEKSAIIQSLGKIGTPRGAIVFHFDELIADVQTEPVVLEYALYNLPQLVDHEYPIEKLRPLTQHSNAQVVRAANWAIEKIRPHLK